MLLKTAFRMVKRWLRRSKYLAMNDETGYLVMNDDTGMHVVLKD